MVETISMNDLRYNMYGGARYPAPAAVGAFGSNLSSGIATAMNNSSSQLDGAAAPVMRRHSAPSVKARPKAPPPNNDIEIYRGTKSDTVKAGGL